MFTFGCYFSCFALVVVSLSSFWIFVFLFEVKNNMVGKFSLERHEVNNVLTLIFQDTFKLKGMLLNK